MKSLLFACILVLIVGSAVSQKAPPVPKLPQQFYTNFTVVLPGYVSPSDSPVFVSGFFALDYVNAGSFLEIGGEECKLVIGASFRSSEINFVSSLDIPLTFHTNLVVSPDGQGNMNGFQFEGPLCWNFGSVPASFLVFFPFQLPSNVTYLGNKVVSGQACSGWKFNADVFGASNPVNVWVSTSATTIVQIDVIDLDYLGDLQLNFFNTVAGPFSPSIYAPPNKVNPNLTCTPFSWLSMVKRMTNLMKLL